MRRAGTAQQPTSPTRSNLSRGGITLEAAVKIALESEPRRRDRARRAESRDRRGARTAGRVRHAGSGENSSTRYPTAGAHAEREGSGTGAAHRSVGRACRRATRLQPAAGALAPAWRRARRTAGRGAGQRHRRDLAGHRGADQGARRPDRRSGERGGPRATERHPQRLPRLGRLPTLRMARLARSTASRKERTGCGGWARRPTTKCCTTAASRSTSRAAHAPA